MVHVGICPCDLGRGKPSTEFCDKNGKPQIYCYGWGHDKDDIDTAFDCCKECKDWVHGDQVEIDREKIWGNKL